MTIMRYSLLAFLVGFSTLAHAGATGAPTYLDFNIIGFDGGYNIGEDGGPASGSGNFSGTPPGVPTGQGLTYFFETGYALTWHDSYRDYYATFGYGGMFQMSLPNGLTFNGVVTSGSSAYYGDGSYVEVNYFGQWSNGLYATGTAYDYQMFPNSVMQQLSSQIAPEPSSWLLMGSGILALWWKRRG